MTVRASLVTACLVALVVVSLPAGAYTGASGPDSTASAALEPDDESVIDSLGCLPAPSLRDVSMDAYRQEATNLRTQGGSVSTSTDGEPDVDETFRIESGYIAAGAMCFDGTADGSDGIRLELNDVRFEDTELAGPWTDVEFDEGEADSMTVVLPPEEVLNLLKQIPGSIDLRNTIRDAFGLEPVIDNEARNESDDETTTVVDDTVDDTTDTVENTTDTVDDTVDNTTEVVNETIGSDNGTIDNTTDTVDDTVDNTTGTVDDTVDETTDTVNDTVDNTTGVVDDTVENTTDAVDGTVDDTTDVIDPANDTTEIVDGTVDNTTDTVDDTVDDTTDGVNDTVDDTTDAVGDTVGGTTDVIGGLVSGTASLVSG